MKKKIYKKVKKVIDDNKYSPKKEKDLKAVSFKSKNPVGNGEYHNYLFFCTEWSNGEGFEININWDYKDKSSDKHLSLSRNEIEGILYCLNDFNYFD